MPLDTRIALGGQSLQLESPLAQYGQLMNVVNAGTQNQLAQMQMQEQQQMAPLRMQEAQSKAAMSKLTFDQTVEARDFLTKTMKAAEENSNGTAPKDPLAVIKAFLGHPNKQVQDVGTHMANAYQLIQDFEADQRYATAKGGGVAPMALPPAAPAAPASMAAPVNALAPAAAPATNVNAMAAPVAKTAADIKAEIDSGDLQFGRSKRWAKERELLVDQYKEAIKSPTLHTVAEGSALIGPGGKPIYTAPAKTNEFEQLLTAAGMTEDQKKAARASRVAKESTFAPPMQVVMPVAIQDPKDPTKVIYVDRSQAIGQTPAAEVPKPLTATQTQKLRTEKAADTAHVNASQSTADELDRLTTQLVGSEDKKIKPHPGLAAITGYRALLPNLPESDARKAQQKLDTFKGKILALGREMASQNGKLGNMAVQEWKFVSDAVQALDPKAGNLDVQMRDVVRQAQAFAKNQKSKFESTYEDTGAVAPAAGSGIDTSNPLLR